MFFHSRKIRADGHSAGCSIFARFLRKGRIPPLHFSFRIVGISATQSSLRVKFLVGPPGYPYADSAREHSGQILCEIFASECERT